MCWAQIGQVELKVQSLICIDDGQNFIVAPSSSFLTSVGTELSSCVKRINSALVDEDQEGKTSFVFDMWDSV